MSSSSNSLPLHAFRNRDNILAKAAMRDALLTHSIVRQALNQYLLHLNLEGQVKAGIMTPNQALVAYEKAIQNFSRNLHTAINQSYINNGFNQTPMNIALALNNPLNMANALNNPLSFVSQEMNDIAGALEASMNQEAADNLAAQETQQVDQQQATQESTPEKNSDKYLNDEKYAALTSAVVAIDDIGPSSEIAKNKVESSFFKSTGIESDFHKVEQEAKEHEDNKPSFLKHELKPQHEGRGGDDDKRKG